MIKEGLSLLLFFFSLYLQHYNIPSAKAVVTAETMVTTDNVQEQRLKQAQPKIWPACHPDSAWYWMNGEENYGACVRTIHLLCAFPGLASPESRFCIRVCLLPTVEPRSDAFIIILSPHLCIWLPQWFVLKSVWAMEEES